MPEQSKDSTSPETEPKQRLQKSLTRRKFLKGVTALVGLGVAAKVIPSFLQSQETSLEDRENSLPITQSESLSEDALTDEELTEAHIRIVQSPSVKLHLRKGVFEFPLFQDARDGKITELTIVLVDTPILSWNAGEEMPPDVRGIWQRDRINPAEHPEEYWEKEVKFRGDLLENEYKMLEFWNKQMQEFARDEEDRKRYEDYITNSQKRIEEGERELSIFQDRPRAIAWEADNKGPEATFIRPDRLLEPPEDMQRLYPNWVQRRESLQSDPAFKNKAFIIMAVGQKLRPQPSQSFPHPEQFKEWPWIPDFREQGKEKDHLHRFSDPFTAGTTLRHEVFHYQGVDKESVGEYDTDTRMFESIEQAWDKYQNTGDSSGYPFVFVTPEGITITRKSPTTSEKQLV